MPENLPQRKTPRFRRAVNVLQLSSLAVLLVASSIPAKAQSSTTTPAQSTKSPAERIAKHADPAAPIESAHTPAVPLQPAPKGFDIQAGDRDVLSHLSAVVRFFRLALTPIQKVGEPSDLLYREQALTQSTQVADLAFQSAKAEASLLSAYQKELGTQSAPAIEGEAQKLQTVRAGVNQRLSDLSTQTQSLQDQISHAKPQQRAALQQQKEQIDGALELTSAMSDSLAKIVSLSGPQSNVGLAADIDRLQRSTPELAASASKTVVPPPLQSLSAARSAGVSSQAVVLFQLLSTRHDLDQWLASEEALHTQAMGLRDPLTQVVRGLVQSGQALSQQAQTGVSAPSPTPAAATPAAATPAQAADQVRKRYDSVTATFQVVSSAVVPLSQEIILLEQTRANLLAWRAAVDEEYRGVLRSLLLHVLVIAVALAVIFSLGEVWRRATLRYVHDIRRRRQLLVMRRIVTGFLSGLVVILGFVSQFNSLATFAGFITAGLAVGLQTILLSVAAYFFIVGRYGVRVGDRITVAGVTGDVIDVGLVRFYMMELAGTGTELHPTGRVAVFSNSVLFQAGTPLYKQMPGSEYAWHELTVKLAQAANYGGAAERLLNAVKTIYEGYRPSIEQQYHDVQAWMESPIDAPGIESRLQLVDGGLQLWVRYPVELREAAEIDEQITQSLLGLMSKDEEVKVAVTGTPAIRAIVKG